MLAQRRKRKARNWKWVLQNHKNLLRILQRYFLKWFIFWSDVVMSSHFATSKTNYNYFVQQFLLWAYLLHFDRFLHTPTQNIFATFRFRIFDNFIMNFSSLMGLSRIVEFFTNVQNIFSFKRQKVYISTLFQSKMCHENDKNLCIGQTFSFWLVSP